MATVITKPASHPPKMKRPPPPLGGQSGLNGIRAPQQSPSSSSPSSASKRLPGSGQLDAANATSGQMANGVNGASFLNSSNNKGPLNRPRRDAQRIADHPTRVQRSLSKTMPTDNDRRVGKKCPEPYVKTTPYILKKYAKHPPSLIVHLHPTHFRFEQQDGSFPYNSEMKVIIEHIRAGTVPHDMMEELLRANVRFYEGCLIVRVVDHKSATAQARKATATQSNDNNSPFSIHNYNEHITPSPFVPYPKHNQLASEQTVAKTETATNSTPDQNQNKEAVKDASAKEAQAPLKPKVFTTVLHPTTRSLQAELTLLATTPDPRAARQQAEPSNDQTNGHVAKRQKMLVEPQHLLECESKLTRALAPPLFLEPVDSLGAVQDLLKFMESPMHRDPPPSPKRRKRTVAELEADEALAAEEERFMLIMDERLESSVSNGAGGTKSAVDETSGGAPFEPRFSRFKTLENIRMQHEEKAKREHEIKLKQEMAKRQQQDMERERRRFLEQQQAQERAREEIHRQQLAAQQAQAQLAAQQQQSRLAQANGVSQGQQSSPVARNQTPLNVSSPMVGNTMATQGAVPMSITSSAQGGAGSPPRPPSALQHAHPGVIGHPMAPSRSQQGGQSRHGTPQVTQGTPAMSHATPIMRNATPRMNHGSPSHSGISQTPVMNQGMMATPQMGGGGMGLTPQQQQLLLHQRQQAMIAAQQGNLGHSGLTPQQFSHLQANAHAQQNIQQYQQHLLQQQQQNQQQQQRIPNQHAYQAQLMRAQLTQMQMAQNQQQQHAQHPQPQNQQVQAQQNGGHQGSPQMTPQQQQQQQILMAAAQANGGHLPQNFQGMNMAQRYTQLYHQRLLRLRQEMAHRFTGQYGPPSQYPPHIAQQYGLGLERSAKVWVNELMKRERESVQQQRASQVAAVQAQVMQQQQQQQQNMMRNA